jgi:hypothetical protein
MNFDISSETRIKLELFTAIESFLEGSRICYGVVNIHDVLRPSSVSIATDWFTCDAPGRDSHSQNNVMTL